MSRREVVEIKCDRCNRLEIQSKDEVSPERVKELTCTYGKETLVFKDLCRTCKKTVENIFSRLRRDPEKKESTTSKNPVGQKKTTAN